MPVYHHDCDRCQFKGTVKLDDQHVYDIYVCPGAFDSLDLSSVLARYDNEASHYASSNLANMADVVAHMGKRGFCGDMDGNVVANMLPYQRAMVIGLCFGEWPRTYNRATSGYFDEADTPKAGNALRKALTALVMAIGEAANFQYQPFRQALDNARKLLERK